MRRICYLTGTRADFGLMRSTLERIADTPGLCIELAVTGMHLSERHGGTVREVQATGLPIRATLPVPSGTASGATMARQLAATLEGLVDTLSTSPPDLLLLLGDRGEMMAGALAALHLNVPVVHIHGGERSGTIDEPVRHAISKLAHYHFTATRPSRERLVAMGERPENVFVTGAPGLDGLETLARRERASLCSEIGLDATRRTALFIHHPVVQEGDAAAAEASALLDACLNRGLQVVALMPNADAGSEAVRAVLESAKQRPGVSVLTHLPRPDFVSWMAHCDVMVGNSSSGIIEAASFGTPVLNVGSRQQLRERNANVADAPSIADIPAQLDAQLQQHRFAIGNLYGDGRSGPRIAELLTQLDLSPAILHKRNAY